MSDNFDEFDFDEFDLEPEDDIVESFEDDEEDSAGERRQLTNEEIQQRLEVYQNESKDKMRIIVKAKQYDKAQRVAAMRWLGESGNHEAIEQIVKVYNKDRTPGMKDEAAFALGQFKALDSAYSDQEIRQETEERINNIILYDERGKRASAGKWVTIEIGLVVLAVVLFALGGFLNRAVAVPRANERGTSVAETQTAQPTPTADTEDIVQAQISAYYGSLLADANFLQLQLAATSRGDSIDCQAELTIPATYNLSSMWQSHPAYPNIVNALNSVRNNMTPIYSAYNTACTSAQPIQDALNLGSTLIDAQTTLRGLRLDLAGNSIEVDDQAIATATPAPTESPIDPELLDETTSELRAIINEMTQTGGPTAVILFNWQQVIDSGDIYRSGCNQPEPLIPTDYVLPPDLAGTSAQLDSVVGNINLGLSQTRDASTAFFEMCTANAVPSNADARLGQANLAQTAFDSASSTLDLIRN